MIEPLSLWNPTLTRQAILDYVDAVTRPDSPDFVPPPERIATFDNDGTLWLEKPYYIQLSHGLRSLARAAAANILCTTCSISGALILWLCAMITNRISTRLLK